MFITIPRESACLLSIPGLEQPHVAPGSNLAQAERIKMIRTCRALYVSRESKSIRNTSSSS